MNALKGYKTVTIMALGLIYSLLAGTGFMVPESEQAAISAGVISIVGILLRFVTDSKVGES